MRLCFEPDRPSIERTRVAFAMLGSALTGRAVELVQTHRLAKPDPNHAGLTYEAEHRDHEIELRESVLGGSGNPRDGYAYEVSFVLSVPISERVVRVVLRHRGEDPAPARFEVDIEGATAAEQVLLREAARSVFGEDAERTAGPAGKRIGR